MNMHSIFNSLILILLIAFSACQNAVENSGAIDLSGSWQFQKQGDSIWFPAIVPGTIQTDLFANNQIPELFYSEKQMDRK
jgi:beta-mannosidase